MKGTSKAKLKSGSSPKILFLFVDGLGIPKGKALFKKSPFHKHLAPNLWNAIKKYAKPIDATMGIQGIPQSATGQTAILTGVNAAKMLGRHIEGFPNTKLKNIIETQNIFLKLKEIGKTSTFANAYFTNDMEEVKKRRFLSVTSVAALSAFGRVRDINQMIKNDAVYQDLTRETLFQRGYTGKKISPRKAARHLLNIFKQYDFTFFEYFLTDRAGHKLDQTFIQKVLTEFDEFFSELFYWFLKEKKHIFILTSDHGNIEDITRSTHTTNHVPLIVIGEKSHIIKQDTKSITDITPAIIRFYKKIRN